MLTLLFPQLSKVTMRIRGKLSRLAVALAISGFSSAQAGVPGSPAISISISAYRDVAPAGVPLKIKAEVKNSSGEPIGDSYYGYDVMVWDENGQPVAKAEKELGRERGPISLRRSSIEPREVRKHVYIVNDIYDIARPGRYSIQVRRSDIASNTIVVTVVNPDATPASVEPSNASFSLEIDASPDVVKPGSKVELVIETTNNTAQVMNVDNASTLYSVSVRNDQGVSPSLTDMGRKQQELFGQSSGRVAMQLKPGATEITGSIRIDELYDLSQPGEYTIEISRTDDESKILVKSNKTTVTVVHDTTSRLLRSALDSPPASGSINNLSQSKNPASFAL